jgi:hypothetical protein
VSVNLISRDGARSASRTGVGRITRSSIRPASATRRSSSRRRGSASRSPAGPTAPTPSWSPRSAPRWTRHAAAAPYRIEVVRDAKAPKRRADRGPAEAVEVPPAGRARRRRRRIRGRKARCPPPADPAASSPAPAPAEPAAAATAPATDDPAGSPEDRRGRSTTVLRVYAATDHGRRQGPARDPRVPRHGSRPRRDAGGPRGGDRRRGQPAASCSAPRCGSSATSPSTGPTAKVRCGCSR